jgi:hypothetical protein
VAKKTRTPPPPRRVQAPQRRDSSGRPVGTGSRRTLWFGLGAAAAAVAVGVIVALVVLGGGGSSKAATSLTATMRAAGCTLHTYPSQGRQHTSKLTAKIKYNSFPPTSGTHYYVPAVWNFYTSPLVLVQEVHNLEHGGIVVQWGNQVPQSTVAKIRDFWQADPDAMLMAPLPKLGNKIALTAWTHLATCTHFSDRAFSAFRDAYRGKGPEKFPVSSLTPGS